MHFLTAKNLPSQVWYLLALQTERSAVAIKITCFHWTVTRQLGSAPVSKHFQKLQLTALLSMESESVQSVRAPKLIHDTEMNPGLCNQVVC